MVVVLQPLADLEDLVVVEEDIVAVLDLVIH